MGCEDSKLSTSSHAQPSISVTIIDPAFLKPANEPLRSSLQAQGVNVKTYMSVSCFISEQNGAYANNVMVRHQ
jgi:hypothetical protein